MIKIFIFILLLPILASEQTLPSQAPKKDTGQIVDSWKMLDQPTYSIQYPASWEMNQSGAMGTSFMIFSPLESDKDKFKENVNLMVQDLSGKNIDLDKYIEISAAEIKAILTKPVFLENKKMNDGQNEYYKLIYSGDQGIFHLEFEQYCWLINNKALILTFTSEKNKFADYQETAEKILNSFTIKE